MEIKVQSFKNKEFIVVKGSTHPEYSFHTFEREECDFRDKYWNIKEGDVVFDIGSSYGSYALTACAMGAKVYAFEPEPTVFAGLVDNINANKWKDKCTANNIGIYSSSNIIDMKSYAPHWPAHTITCDYRTDTIDHFCQENKISKLDWMKIDVEGVEVHAIKGGLETLKALKPKLIIECHIFLDTTIVDQIKNILSDIYTFEEIDRNPCIMLIGNACK